MIVAYTVESLYMLKGHQGMDTLTPAWVYNYRETIPYRERDPINQDNYLDRVNVLTTVHPTSTDDRGGGREVHRR